MVWYGMVWYGMVWYVMLCYVMLCYVMSSPPDVTWYQAIGKRTETAQDQFWRKKNSLS